MPVPREWGRQRALSPFLPHHPVSALLCCRPVRPTVIGADEEYLNADGALAHLLADAHRLGYAEAVAAALPEAAATAAALSLPSTPDGGGAMSPAGGGSGAPLAAGAGGSAAPAPSAGGVMGSLRDLLGFVAAVVRDYPAEAYGAVDTVRRLNAASKTSRGPPRSARAPLGLEFDVIADGGDLCLCSECVSRRRRARGHSPPHHLVPLIRFSLSSEVLHAAIATSGLRAGGGDGGGEDGTESERLFPSLSNGAPPAASGGGTLYGGQHFLLNGGAEAAAPHQRPAQSPSSASSFTADDGGRCSFPASASGRESAASELLGDLDSQPQQQLEGEGGGPAAAAAPQPQVRMGSGAPVPQPSLPPAPPSRTFGPPGRTPAPLGFSPQPIVLSARRGGAEEEDEEAEGAADATAASPPSRGMAEGTAGSTHASAPDSSLPDWTPHGSSASSDCGEGGASQAFAQQRHRDDAEQRQKPPQQQQQMLPLQPLLPPRPTATSSGAAAATAAAASPRRPPAPPSVVSAAAAPPRRPPPPPSILPASAATGSGSSSASSGTPRSTGDGGAPPAGSFSGAPLFGAPGGLRLRAPRVAESSDARTPPGSAPAAAALDDAGEAAAASAAALQYSGSQTDSGMRAGFPAPAPPPADAAAASHRHLRLSGTERGAPRLPRALAPLSELPKRRDLAALAHCASGIASPTAGGSEQRFLDEPVPITPSAGDASSLVYQQLHAAAAAAGAASPVLQPSAMRRTPALAAAAAAASGGGPDGAPTGLALGASALDPPTSTTPGLDASTSSSFGGGGGLSRHAASWDEGRRLLSGRLPSWTLVRAASDGSRAKTPVIGSPTVAAAAAPIPERPPPASGSSLEGPPLQPQAPGSDADRGSRSSLPSAASPLPSPALGSTAFHRPAGIRRTASLASASGGVGGGDGDVSPASLPPAAGSATTPLVPPAQDASPPGLGDAVPTPPAGAPAAAAAAADVWGAVSRPSSAASSSAGAGEDDLLPPGEEVSMDLGGAGEEGGGAALGGAAKAPNGAALAAAVAPQPDAAPAAAADVAASTPFFSPQHAASPAASGCSEAATPPTPHTPSTALSGSLGAAPGDVSSSSAKGTSRLLVPPPPPVLLAHPPSSSSVPTGPPSSSAASSSTVRAALPRHPGHATPPPLRREWNYGASIAHSGPEPYGLGDATTVGGVGGVVGPARLVAALAHALIRLSPATCGEYEGIVKTAAAACRWGRGRAVGKGHGVHSQPAPPCLSPPILSCDEGVGRYIASRLLDSWPRNDSEKERLLIPFVAATLPAWAGPGALRPGSTCLAVDAAECGIRLPTAPDLLRRVVARMCLCIRSRHTAVANAAIFACLPRSTPT